MFGAIAANRRRTTTVRSAPTLDYPTTANPPVVNAHLPVDAIAGDILYLYWSQSESFASGVSSGSHTLTSGEVSGGTVTGFSIPTLSTGAPWYFRSQVSLTGTFSNTVAWNDATAPTITTNAAQTQMELFPLSVALTASKTVAWSIVGGTDQLQYEISGTTLRWAANGSANYDVPTDSDANNTYVVIVRATDLAGNTTDKTITTTVTAADKTCDAFSFTDVIPSTVSTVYTSNTITISGLTAGVSVAATVTGAQYSKNSGAFTAAGSFTVQNGDTVALKVTSGSGSTDTVNSVLNVNGVSDTWTVSNTANTAAWATANGTNKNSNITISGAASLSFSCPNVLATQLVRANAAASSKRYFELTLNSTPSGDFQCGIDDGTTSFGPTTTAAIPGAATSTGLSFQNGSWGWEIKTASTVLISDYASAGKAAVSGDIIGFEFDTTAHTCQIWRKKSGTWTSLGTVSTGFSLSAYYAYAGVNNDGGSAASGTANFGATAFDRTPSTGFVGYGN